MAEAENSQEFTVSRTLHEVSGSYLVSLPRMWVQREALRKGDKVVLAFRPGLVRISPARPEQQE